MDDIGVINGCQNGRLQSAAGVPDGTRGGFPLPIKVAGNVKLYHGPAVRRWLADREKRKKAK